MTLPSPVTQPYSTLSPEQIGLPAPAFRLADAPLGKVTLQVADLERSLAFYQNVIGLRLTGQEGRTARLGVPGSETLLELREKPGVKFAPHRGRLGLYHLALLLPTRGDLGRFIEQALAQGVHVGQSDHHFSEATYLVDPDGISVEVYRDRPRGEWRVTAEGEIIGGMGPLDREALAQAAHTEGDPVWRGMPAGTTMGHLHFYVGDLEAAAAFYHAALGLDKVTWSAPGALFLAAGGYHHQLGLNTWAAGSAPSGDDDARLLTWELRLPETDVARVAASFRAAGYATTEVDGGVQVNDPWGITLRLASSAAPSGREAALGE